MSGRSGEGRETAPRYVADIAAELALMASHIRHERLVRLIRAAQREAERLVERGGEPDGDPGLMRRG